MRVEAYTLVVHPRRAFTIYRSSATSFRRVVLELEEDGVMGRGEAAPSAYYGQDAARVLSALGQVEVPDPWDIEGTMRVNASLPPSALAALDMALHDLAARRLGIPVWKLLGLGCPRPVTAYTIGMGGLETVLTQLEHGPEYPILKMKVGETGDLATVRAVMEASGAEVWVDANEAWDPEQAPRLALELKELGVKLIEQPVAAAAGPEALRRVTEAVAPLPIIADESAISARDIPELAGCVSGVNVKLAKCGGIRAALEVIHTARAHGMQVMLGCMVETSLGIAAATQISGLADYVDLDGFLLLADDPFKGLSFKDGRIVLPDEPGLGMDLL